MIRLVVVSDIRLFSDGLAEILGQSGQITIIAVANTVEKSITDIQQLSPDVVLLDMNISNSCHAVTEITRHCPATRIVAFAMPENDTHIHICAEAGITGYVAREDSLQVLIKAIEDSYAGEIYCPSHLASCLFRKVEALARNDHSNKSYTQSTTRSDSQTKSPVTQLTRRERQIAGLLSQGLSNKQIARDLSIELSTVKNHIHNILVKVGAKNRMQAVLILQNSFPSQFSRSMDLELRC